MQLTINGEPCTFAQTLPDPLTLADLVERQLTSTRRAGSTPGAGSTRGAAVAVDRQVVPRSGWGAFVLRDGQAIEILTAVQGG